MVIKYELRYFSCNEPFSSSAISNCRVMGDKLTTTGR